MAVMLVGNSLLIQAALVVCCINTGIQSAFQLDDFGDVVFKDPAIANNLIRYPFPAGVPHLDDLETIRLVQSVGLYMALCGVIVVVGYLTYMLYKVNMTAFFTKLNC